MHTLSHRQGERTAVGPHCGPEAQARGAAWKESAGGGQWILTIQLPAPGRHRRNSKGAGPEKLTHRTGTAREDHGSPSHSAASGSDPTRSVASLGHRHRPNNKPEKGQVVGGWGGEPGSLKISSPYAVTWQVRAEKDQT